MDPEFIDFSLFVTFSIFSHSFFIASFPSSFFLLSPPFFFFFILFSLSFISLQSLPPPFALLLLHSSTHFLHYLFFFSIYFHSPTIHFIPFSFASASLYFVLPLLFTLFTLLSPILFAFYDAHFSLVLSTFLHHSSCEKTAPFTFSL